MAGPLPNPSRRRRNVPTIPTTHLPAGGWRGRAPRVPSWIELGKAGRAWWRWAWSTPHAAGWAAGHEVVVARRASLEDDLVALGAIVGGLDLDDLLRNEDHEDLLKQIRWVVGSLQRLAGGRLAIAREMRELDDRLGLTPKGMAALRWTIRPEDASATSLVDGPPPEGVADLEARRRRLASDAT